MNPSVPPPSSVGSRTKQEPSTRRHDPSPAIGRPPPNVELLVDAFDGRSTMRSAVLRRWQLDHWRPEHDERS